MTNKPPVTVRLLLTNEDGLGRIEVDMDAFFQFSFWIAEELEDLVASRAEMRRPRNIPSRRTRLRPLDP